MNRQILLAALLSAGFLSAAAAPLAVSYAADDPPPAEDASTEAPMSDAELAAKADEFVQSLHPQSGKIELPGGIATLDLDQDFRYITPSDAKTLLEKGWGNPPGAADGVLGMLIPKSPNPLAKGGWGVVIEYSDDGHVSDKDADKIDYNDILKGMKEQAQAQNEERKKEGYEPVTVAGWAEPPHYDKGEHKIFWAKDLVFGDGAQQEHSLNYFIRVLGRKGILELNAVAGMDQLEQVRTDMKKVVGFAEFTKGNTYADFDSSTDKVAAYGLAALVAGGIAAKTGLFAKLLALAFAAKKAIVLAIAGIGAAIAKVFKKRA